MSKVEFLNEKSKLEHDLYKTIPFMLYYCIITHAHA